MAYTAALISYPCFKDLEKSNINFVECGSHQKKYRKSRHDKKSSSVQKENYNVDHNFTCNRENSTTNTSKVKKKDIEILSTVHENEEREESRKALNEVVKTSGLPTNEKSAVCDEADSIFSSYEGRMERRFSNHSLVTYDTFEEHQTSKLLQDLNMQENNRKITSNLTECRTSPNSNLCLSQKRSDNCKLQALNCEPHMTLMPNTNEFDEDLHESMKCNLNGLEFASRKMSKVKENTGEGSARNWRIILGVIWAISLIAAIISMTVIDVATQSPRIQPVVLATFTPTNYEICLLIGKNVCRLIASSVVNLLH